MNGMPDPGQLRVVISVLIPMIPGATIGIDREMAKKPAWMRAHMFAAGAAALLTW